MKRDNLLLKLEQRFSAESDEMATAVVLTPAMLSSNSDAHERYYSVESVKGHEDKVRSVSRWGE